MFVWYRYKTIKFIVYITKGRVSETEVVNLLLSLQILTSKNEISLFCSTSERKLVLRCWWFIWSTSFSNYVYEGKVKKCRQFIFCKHLAKNLQENHFFSSWHKKLWGSVGYKKDPMETPSIWVKYYPSKMKHDSNAVNLGSYFSSSILIV